MKIFLLTLHTKLTAYCLLLYFVHIYSEFHLFVWLSFFINFSFTLSFYVRNQLFSICTHMHLCIIEHVIITFYLNSCLFALPQLQAFLSFASLGQGLIWGGTYSSGLRMLEIFLNLYQKICTFQAFSGCSFLKIWFSFEPKRQISVLWYVSYSLLKYD